RGSVRVRARRRRQPGPDSGAEKRRVRAAEDSDARQSARQAPGPETAGCSHSRRVVPGDAVASAAAARSQGSAGPRGEDRGQARGVGSGAVGAAQYQRVFAAALENNGEPSRVSGRVKVRTRPLTRLGSLTRIRTP